MVNRLKICLFGLGHAGRSYLTALQSYGNDIEIYIVDVDDRVANHIPLGMNFYTKIPNVHMDLTIIATPPATHLQVYKEVQHMCERAIVEKPFSIDPKELDEFFHLARENNIFFSIHAIYGKELNYPLNKTEIDYSQVSQLFCDPYSINTPMNSGGAFWDSAFNALGIINKILNVKDIEVQKIITHTFDYFEMDSVLHTDIDEINYKLRIDWQKKINLKVTEICSENRAHGFLFNHSQKCVSDLNGLHFWSDPLTQARLSTHYKSVIEECLSADSSKANNSFAQKITDQVLKVRKSSLSNSPGT